MMRSLSSDLWVVCPGAGPGGRVERGLASHCQRARVCRDPRARALPYILPATLDYGGDAVAVGM